MFKRKIVLNSFHFFRIFLVWLCVYFFINHLQSNLERFLNHFTNLQFGYSENNRDLQDFIISGYREASFYQTGRQRDISNFYSGQKSIINNLTEIGTEARSNHVSIGSEMNILLQMHRQLSDSVNKLIMLYKGRGFKDFGAEGKIRKYAHFLEDSSPMQKQDILMMRRREKDYIMREEPKYTDAFNKIADEQIIKFATDQRTVSELENYKSAFNEYVFFSKQIGFFENTGLYKSIRNLILKMDTQYRAAKDKAISEVNHINFIFNIILTVIFAFLLGAAIGLNFDMRKRQRELERTAGELSDRCSDLLQFNYIVSHNLRSPLGQIKALASLLKAGATTMEEKEAYIAHIVSSVSVLDTTIKDLNLILETKSSVNSRKESVSILSLLQTITNALQKELNDSGALLQIDIGKNASDLFTVKVYLESVLYNLISNAIKYRAHDRITEIKVSTVRNGENIIITVADNGIGIDMKKHQNQLFGLYKRFNTDVEGKGLGLYMTKSQIETMGGKIDVESEPGAGTRFMVTLPVGNG